ncbi:MAG: NUDIX domain-containing protein [Euryarchaeota archaeon]|jgi:8-oxo-dGTP diphosphatase|nr:NUDIX domain-containing protein [Euryarchaeota archaeon]MBT7987968.1 NUDIX domain-containing protein [Euryarchaeota archaeon]
MVRILVTGFEPFGDHKTNISMDILENVPEILTISDPWQNYRDKKLSNQQIFVEKMVLTVDQNGSNAIAKRLEQGEVWDAIIHLGLCDSCDQIRLETTAKNVLDMRISDNSGRMVKDSKLGDSDILANDALIQRLSYPPIKYITKSNDAGSFICNETYYQTLLALSTKHLQNRIQCCFIHLPSEDRIPAAESLTSLYQIFSRLFFKPVIEVVGGLIIDDGKMLLARRNMSSNMPGKWEFPGGKVEANESLVEAIIREIKEEFNWHVIECTNFGKWFFEYDELCVVLHLMRLSLTANQRYDNVDEWTSHDYISWFDSIGEVDLLGADKDAAKEVLRILKSK